MGFWDMMSISASALSAERQRAEVTSANLANAETTHTDGGGGPYVRKEVVFSATECLALPDRLQPRRAFRCAGGIGAAQRRGGRQRAAGDAV